MRIRLTLCRGSTRAPDNGDEPVCVDVLIDAPFGACVGDLITHLVTHAAPVIGADVSSLWSGSTALRADTPIGSGVVRSGCVLGVDGPGPRRTTASALLRVQVVAGPDSGRTMDLARGPFVIGRAAECDLRLLDANVSRHHLELTATAHGVSVRDLGSTNGSRLIGAGGSPPDAIDTDGTNLPIGSYLQIGDSMLSVATVTVPAAACRDDDDGGVIVNRPPRLRVRLAPRSVEFDTTSGPTQRMALPWLAALLPALAGAGLAWFLHNIEFLAFVLLSPLVMIGTGIGERVSGRRGLRRGRIERRGRLARSRVEFQRLSAEETQFRRGAHPDPAAVSRSALTPDARIWERRRRDPDLLEVSLGLSDRPATFTVRRGHDTVAAPDLAAVPLVSDLRRGALGICGPRPLAIGLARWVIAQLSVQHSPNEVTMVGLINDVDRASWDWMRWLPHVERATGRDPGRDGGRDALAAPAGTFLVGTAERRDRLIAELNTVIDRRRSRSYAGPAMDGASWTGPWVVVVVDRSAEQSAQPGLRRILDDGPAVGITAVCIDEEGGRLPAACFSVAEVSGDIGTQVRLRTSAGEDSTALLQRVSRTWIDEVARALCPLRDPDDEAGSALPETVGLLDLIGSPGSDDALDIECIRRRWRTSDGAPRTVVGVGQDGPLVIDLARDGPHALVAGTTGSGKSELLQTMVAGLAAGSSPDDLQFVLIDYKGGAAFAQCARLPHTAGLVTDLDAHLTERALRSLRAELRRRERAFADAQITDLEAYRRTARAADVPISRLVLVVDEFAALAEELPDFMTGLIGVAQRGRSLGLHLVLATQRPGGVVSPEIKANTALRIALRVTDSGESSDVIGTDDAATIDPARPGRAWLRTGSGSIEFQSGWLGGSTIQERTGIDKPGSDGPGISVRILDPYGDLADVSSAAPTTRLGDTGESDRSSGAPGREGPSDLARLVDALVKAADGRSRPHRPWLDPLPEMVRSSDLPALVGSGPDAHRSHPFSVPFALVDHPDRQSRGVDSLDLADGGSLLIVGGARSGRTTALRTILTTAAQQLGPEDLHVHAIGGDSLSELTGLTHVGSNLSPTDGGEIDRLLDRLAAEIDQRRATFATLEVSTAAEARARGTSVPALVLVIDGWERFSAELETIDAGRPVDTVLRLVRDVGALGLTVLLTGGRSALIPRVAGAVRRRLILRLDDPEDYLLAGVTRRRIPTHLPAGRALDPDGVERQIVIPDDRFHPGPAKHARSLADHWPAPSPERAAWRIRRLPRRVTLSELAVVDDSRSAVIGVGGDDAHPLAVQAVDGRIRFFVAGPARSGRSTMLLTLLGQLADRPVRLIVAAPLRSPLAQRAERAGLDVVTPGGAVPTGQPDDPLCTRSDPRPVTVLIDDCEQFTDTTSGDWLLGLVRSDDPRLAVFVSGRSDELAVSYRGIGAELRRHRTGVLLQPSPGDGELFATRLPFTRTVGPPGRGYLFADDLINPPRMDCHGPVPIQVAQP